MILLTIISFLYDFVYILTRTYSCISNISISNISRFVTRVTSKTPPMAAYENRVKRGLK